jgi:hypothetical protein
LYSDVVATDFVQIFESWRRVTEMALLQRKLVLKKSRGMHEKHARERKALTGHQGIFLYPCYM